VKGLAVIRQKSGPGWCRQRFGVVPAAPPFINSVNKGYSNFCLVKFILFNKFEAYKVNLSITIKVSVGFEIVLDSN
jgi:hypothetical protein